MDAPAPERGDAEPDADSARGQRRERQAAARPRAGPRGGRSARHDPVLPGPARLMVARLEQDTFPAMGTALAAARAEVEACERALSRFDPGSDLSRLNAAGGAWTPVGERLLAALQAAL